MEGISKEELLSINPWDYETQQDLLNAILLKCTELDPWLPIDENTPKDKSVLVKLDDNTCEVARLTEYGWMSNDGLDFDFGSDIPTYYKELPPDPKDPE